MEHYFDLPVSFQGEKMSFKSRLVTFGYVYKFYVVVNGKELVFEKDDEQNYRVLSGEYALDNKEMDPDLCKAIIQSLEAL